MNSKRRIVKTLFYGVRTVAILNELDRKGNIQASPPGLLLIS